MQPRPQEEHITTTTSTSNMETTRRRKSSSGDAFSFPNTPTHDDFEFGCVTPDSPIDDPFKDSPADHLFFNGRLLPHAFPFQPAANIIKSNNGLVTAASRFTSRTSSMSSSGKEESLTSSRSNSTNSRSSSCSSSARTSYSDCAASERKLIYHGRIRAKHATSRVVSGQVYGSSQSQRWQFITTPVPASLSREGSRRRKMEVVDQGSITRAKRQDQRKVVVVKKQQLGRRLFRWFVSACKECHAIEPSRKAGLGPQK